MEKIMDITPAQLERYRRSAREREAARKQQLAARHKRAWEVAHQAARLLKREFGATRVVIFGSLIHPELFHIHSDIDLAARDIQHYYRAVAHLLDLDPEINVDLIPIEDAKPAILGLIEKEGVEL
jgi:predicted nucleotidyltransferase